METLDPVKPDPLNSRHEEGQTLLNTLKQNLPELEKLLSDTNGHWQGEDGFYRFYHGSLKVYFLQKQTEKILSLINKVREEANIDALNNQFLEIVQEGTNKHFNLEHNQAWSYHTRPILEAYFHSREMLKYMVKYAKKLETAPNMLPSGWAAVLYLFNLR
jgi:hypothetical protein